MSAAATGTSPSPEPSEQTARPLAVVTGASSGIGRSLARQFCEHGFDVVVAAEDDAIHAAAADLEQHGGAVTAVQVDLATADGVAGLYQAVASAGRPVDAAALNVGIGVGGPFAETDLDADLRLVDLNVRSTVHLAKLLVRDMVGRGAGRLLFSSSIAATAPGPYHATYAASKAFVQSFAEAVRHELKDTGVTVTALMPGPTDTEFFERAGMQDTKVAQGRKDDPDDVARDGFDALMAGRDHVDAGSRLNAVQATTATHLPDTAGAAAMARMTEPGKG
jgi:short-subunit dehydrogenase